MRNYLTILCFLFSFSTVLAQEDIVQQAKYHYQLKDYFSAVYYFDLIYQQDSTLTFEGEQYTGTQAIAGKFAALPFQQIQFQVVTKDIQMGINQNCLLIFVNGTLRIDNEANNLKFSQIFQLVSSGGSNFYVRNDMFRINVG